MYYSVKPERLTRRFAAFCRQMTACRGFSSQTATESRGTRHAPKVKPRVWCGMPIPVRVGFCLMRRAGRREKARRLIVLPLFHVLEGESAPSRYNAGKGRWGGLFNRPTGFFSRYPYLAEKPEIPRQGDSREGNEHPFELADP